MPYHPGALVRSSGMNGCFTNDSWMSISQPFTIPNVDFPLSPVSLIFIQTFSIPHNNQIEDPGLRVRVKCQASRQARRRVSRLCRDYIPHIPWSQSKRLSASLIPYYILKVHFAMQYWSIQYLECGDFLHLGRSYNTNRNTNLHLVSNSTHM